MLLIAGEAGIGKTRLLASTERKARELGLAACRGHTQPRDMEVPAAPFLDLARSMVRDDAMADLGRRIEQLLGEAETADAGADGGHRLRRMLSLDLADTLTRGLDGPTVIALEDLHWADDLSLQVLAALATRLEGAPLMVIGTYRSDELYPRVPMREWRTRLLASRLAEEALLSRLTLEDTGRMVSLITASPIPPPAELVAGIHRRTDGVPLHIEELLGTVGGDAVSGGISDAAIPATLEVNIRDRLARRSEVAISVARAGAVIGRRFTGKLAGAASGLALAAVEEGLAELVDHFFVVPLAGGGYDFRHALIRDAIYASIPERARRSMHLLVARAGTPELGDADLSLHLEEAGQGADAHVVALRAARTAARLSAHREALELYRRALRHLPGDAEAAKRAALLEEAGAEALAADDNTEAAALLGSAEEAYLEAGLVAAACAVAAPLVAAHHLLGASLDERLSVLRSAADRLVGEPEDEPTNRVRARLEGALAAAYMLDRRLEDSVTHGARALRMARQAGDAALELDVLATLGSDDLFGGRMDDGWATLEEAIDRARTAGFEGHTARAYRMAGTSASVLVEYDRAERLLREGIEYAERVEMWNHRHYMAAHLGHVLWATGRYNEADQVARHALADGRGGLTTRITALHVIGYVALGRGNLAAAEETLSEALGLAQPMGELQRVSPALWGLAERAELAGDAARAAELCRQGLALSAAVDDAAYLFPFLVTGTRALLGLRQLAEAESWAADVGRRLTQRAIPGTLPAIDHAQGLVLLARSRVSAARVALSSAAAQWQARRRTWEGTPALVELATALLRANRPAEAGRVAEQALEQATGIGQGPVLERARAALSAARTRHPAPEPWAPLSAREFEVARLVSAGATNAAIAEQLGLSPRTVGAHVEHILNKLGMGRRSEIAAWAARVSTGAPRDTIGQ